MASGIAKKNGRAPEGSGRGNQQMLNVAEKPAKATLLTKVGSEFVIQSPDKRAAAWLEDNIKKSQDKITTIVADLTPALARVLMDRNEGNRKIYDGLVTSYARDMANDAWHLNGEPIIVSKDGLLNDGQHRCMAAIEAGRTVPVIFVFGVGRATRTTVDQGRVRTAGDFLAMGGHTNTNVLSAVAGYIWQHANFNSLSPNSRNRPTKGEIVGLIDTHPGIVKSVNKASVPGARTVGGYSMLAFCHWTFSRVANVSAADTFLEMLTGGAGLQNRDPILYVRNRLINERGRLRANDRAELIFKAWNSWRRKEIAHRFEITGGGLPKVEK
jgi:hypothetical protein